MFRLRVLTLLLLCAGARAESIVATIHPDQPGRAIPKSFAGFSREWRKFPFPESGAASEVHPAYLRLIEQLCAFNDEALSIRIGGASAEQAREMPRESERWAQMAQVFKATRTPFIINIGLSRGDVEMAKDYVRTLRAALPAGAIATFELGNEPDGWPGRHKPADHTFEQYLEEFHTIGSQLVPQLTAGLAGPAWAHGAPPGILTAFIAREKPLLNLLTVHAYRFNPASTPPVEKLLEESATAGMAQNLAPGIEAAHAAGLKLRLGECGSAWGGGIPGFSDSFGATLFTLDFLFELANAGLDGVNLHNVGMNAYSVIKEDVDKASGRTLSITAGAPFYGMLVFAEAVANEAQFVPVELSADTGKSRVKLWATLDRKGVLRVVVINKDRENVADMTLHVAGSQAALTRLEAPSLNVTKGIIYAGQTYDGSTDGNPLGTRKEEPVAISGGTLRIQVGPASAALLTITRE